METNYIKEILTVYKLSSFSKAALELNISQSSLSKHIKAIENELDVILFERTTRKVQLTDIGLELVGLFMDMDSTMTEVRSQVNKHRVQISNHVKVISIPVMAQYNITKCISSFLKTYKNVHISFSEVESRNINSMMQKGEAEIAFSRLVDETDRDFEYLPYYEDELVIVVDKGHPLARKKSVDIDEVAFESFVLLDAHTNLYNYFINILQKTNPSPNIVQTSNRPENIVDLVSQKFGISFLFKKQYEFTNKSNTTIININNAPTSLIILKKLKNQKLSKTGLLFWNFVKDIGFQPINVQR